MRNKVISLGIIALMLLGAFTVLIGAGTEDVKAASDDGLASSGDIVVGNSFIKNNKVYIAWDTTVAYGYNDNPKGIITVWKVDDNGNGDPADDENRIRGDLTGIETGLQVLVGKYGEWGKWQRAFGDKYPAEIHAYKAGDNGVLDIKCNWTEYNFTLNLEYIIKPNDPNLYVNVSYIVYNHTDINFIRYSYSQIASIWVTSDPGEMAWFDHYKLSGQPEGAVSDIPKADNKLHVSASPLYGALRASSKNWITGLVPLNISKIQDYYLRIKTGGSYSGWPFRRDIYCVIYNKTTPLSIGTKETVPFIWYAANTSSYNGIENMADTMQKGNMNNVIYKKILDWDVHRDSYNFSNPSTEWSSGGNCYGISSTEILYWEHYIAGDSNVPYFPYQYNSTLHRVVKSTHDFTLPHDYYHRLNNVSLAITMHQVYDPNNRFWANGEHSAEYYLFWNGSKEYKKLEDSIKKGIPSILLLGPNDKHAVVAFGIILYANNTSKIYISDSDSPNEVKYAYYNLTTNTFDYAPVYGYMNGEPFEKEEWHKFLTLSPDIMQRDWFFNWWDDLWHKDWKKVSSWKWWWHYNFVICDKNLVVAAGGKYDYFLTRGDSQTFHREISGSAGITEGNIVVFAIPKGIDFSADPSVSGSSFLYTFTVENTTRGFETYGYLLNMSGEQYNYDIEISDLTEGISVKPTNGSINLNFTVIHSDADGHYYAMNATNLPIKDNDRAAFTVKDWSLLNDTTEPAVELKLYEGDSTKPKASYKLMNGQDGLSSLPSQSGGLLAQSWVFIVIIVVLITLLGISLLRKRPRTPVNQLDNSEQPYNSENYEPVYQQPPPGEFSYPSEQELPPPPEEGQYPSQYGEEER